MDIFIEGLEVYGHHGVAPEEKVLGQCYVFNLRLTLEDCPAAFSDRLDDAIDYTEVIDLVIDVATTESYSLLERLARVTAEAILKKFPIDEVWVHIVKPHPPIACSLTGVSAAIELQRADLEG
ncbi:MAG: dihydroneopterin aldolase [Actinobacteria bacterium]|nr:dihydroneopterin aldolase [Actinomycetota bacterium]